MLCSFQLAPSHDTVPMACSLYVMTVVHRWLNRLPNGGYAHAHVAMCRGNLPCACSFKELIQYIEWLEACDAKPSAAEGDHAVDDSAADRMLREALKNIQLNTRRYVSYDRSDARLTRLPRCLPRPLLCASAPVLPVPAASHPIRQSSAQPRRSPRAAVLSKVTHSAFVASPIGTLQRRACKCIACAMWVLVAFRIASVPWPPQQACAVRPRSLARPHRIASHRIRNMRQRQSYARLAARTDRKHRAVHCVQVRAKAAQLAPPPAAGPPVLSARLPPRLDGRARVGLARADARSALRAGPSADSFVRSGAARSVPLRVAPPHAPHRIALCERDSNAVRPVGLVWPNRRAPLAA